MRITIGASWAPGSSERRRGYVRSAGAHGRRFWWTSVTLVWLVGIGLSGLRINFTPGVIVASEPTGNDADSEALIGDGN